MSQLAFVGSDILTAVKDFFQELGKELAELWFWPAIFVGLMVLAIITMIFLVRFSYENRILKSINKLNKYFLVKPNITEENLVEFNLKMKKVPAVLRSNWQVYMLNREDTPTKYMNVDTCIDKPLRTSSIEKNMGNFTIFSVFLGLFSFAVGLVYATHVAGTNIVGDVLFLAVLVPLAICILYTVFFLVIKASKNDIYSCLYENFPLFERNLSKAVETLPAYVDYEILFTKKEIKDGIPILQQYLEKRAKVEEEELEKARENSMATEEYDFDELGVDGSLVLERAMKESETFIKVRRRLQDEINSIETEKDNYKKTFDQTLKDMQRKLQASRENLDSLKTQQEASTNRIESNYIRKQQADEIKKQQQLEKDIEEATTKFNDEQETLKKEIDKRQEEIEEKKNFVQQAMLLEFKHYANTLYDALSDKAKEVGNQKLVSLAQENADLKALLTDIHGVGTDETDLNPQDNLIDTKEITSGELYEMSGSDESALEEGRQTSKEMEKEENEKIKEKKDAEKSEKQDDKTADEKADDKKTDDANKDSVKDKKAKDDSTSSDTDKTSNDTDKTSADADDDSKPAEQELDEDNSTDDKDTSEEQPASKPEDEIEKSEPEPQLEQQPAPQEEEKVSAPADEKKKSVKSSKTTNEDLDKIQKQIEEENDRLRKEKAEFENDLNDTISKMKKEAEAPDEGSEESEDDKDEYTLDSKQKDSEQPDKDVEENADLNDEENDEQSDEEKQETENKEPDEQEENNIDEEKKPARRRATSRRIGSAEPERKKRSVSRRRVVSKTSRRAQNDEEGEESKTELDKLNAQMQQILNSSKRR
jgi:hypothetical protein